MHEAIQTEIRQIQVIKKKDQQQTSKEYMNKQDRDKSDDDEPIDQPLTNSQPIVLLTHPLIVH